MLSAQYYNESVKVDSIHNYNQNNEDTLYIANIFSSIQDSDIVLLHQGKGIKWNYGSGTIASDYGYAGRFEILLVLKRSGKSVIVRNISRDGTNSFVPKGLQLVRVGRYTDVSSTKIISSPILAEPWDGEKGGIICIIADTLKLQANISASGCGYQGAQPVNSSNVVCWQSDSNNVSQKNMPLSKIHWAGLKGESIVDADTNYIRGNSPQYSGGGGGNGYHSGGGGGANYLPGGLGGYEALLCSISPDTIGGRGGKGMGTGLLSGYGPVVTFGGGGGCSTQKNGFIATKGGNGGGIIIIMANVLIGNNYILAANGQSVTDTATAGGGGGGAGGTIVLDINEYLTRINVQLKGGNGGSVYTTPPIPGMGGGGAGGYLRFNGTTKSDSVILDLTPGNPGNMSPKINKNAYPGITGFAKGSFVMPVKDFLFNLMPADQEICEGDIPRYIKASVPKGATNTFQYIWRQSTDKINWTKIDSATRYIFQPPALFSTTYYQRIVHAIDGSNNIVASDTSFIYTIKVWPKILNNTIHTDTFAVCKGVPMPQINGSIPTGGNGTYTYQWQDSSRNSPTWKPAQGINNGKNFKPTYTDTIFLRRFITSRACKSTSNTVSIQVLPPLQNNFITDTQWVSLGKTYAPLQAQDASGGDGSYTYVWQKSPNGIAWQTIDSSTNNHVQIIPPPTLPDTQYFRRIVFSGLFNTCKDTTKALPFYALDSIHNNLITGTDTICARTTPAPFIATIPTGGDHSFRYLWQKSTDGINWDTLSTSSATSLNAGIVYQSTYYRRIVFSGRNNACIDTSNIILIFTKPAIENNYILNGTDTTICYGQNPGTLFGSIPQQGDGPYQYQWEFKTSSGSFANASGKYDSIHYETPALFVSTSFRRKIVSGICISYSDTIQIHVLPLLSNNIISKDTIVCKHTAPLPIQGSTPGGGDATDYRFIWQVATQTNWTTAPGVSNQKNYQPMGLDTLTYFRRIVLSGPYNTCRDTSNAVTVGTHQLPTASLLPFDDSICMGQAYKLKIKVAGVGPFTVKYTDQNAVYDTLVNVNESFSWQFYPYAPGKFEYMLAQIIDSHGCSPDSMPGKGTLYVFEVPVAFAGADTEVCGQEVILRANKGIGLGTWTSTIPVTFESGVHAHQTLARSSQYGTHPFTWTLNNGGCIDSSTVYITFDQPPPDPLVGEDQTGPFLFKTRLKAYLPILGTGKWTTTDSTIKISDIFDPEATVENLKFGKNYFQWYVENGVCTSASDTLVVEVTDIRIPEGFSPNGDGKNDTLVIKGLENVSNAELIILNRWGTEVFRSKDYKNNWDGKYKGSILPLDTYYYILNVIGRTYKGFLIIRK